ncbi:GyrI-like domain-containing protein [Pontibacter liquoris]|uniref:GyrI-like domain-containing protein n=1 Tax=Pontibacter liquoris TaxID=2905677 RepID=UPI001FA80A80|nr:GyrI-like domain-containing protein [Pontibacter liquoris]
MKKLLYGIAALAIILLVVYTFIGGFAAPEVRLATSQTRYVAGQPFEGSIKDEALGKAFRRAGELVESKKLAGTPGSIYYNDPEHSGDSLKAFIGVLVTDTSITLPQGYTLRTVPGGRKVVRAEATANVAILPKKLYGAVFDYAKEHKLKLEEFYVEWFPAQDRGVVEVPVKE